MARIVGRHVPVLGLVWLCGPTAANARLGESLEDCVLRYGEQVGTAEKSVAQSDGDAVHFRKSGFDIFVEFRNGMAWSIRFVRRTFSEDERNHLMAINAAGSDWLGPLDFQGREHWIARSGDYHAMMRTEGKDRVLVIVNEQCLQARDRQRLDRLRAGATPIQPKAEDPDEIQPPVESLEGF